jgi:hypothetical protein
VTGTRVPSEDRRCCGDCLVMPFRCQVERKLAAAEYARHNHPDTTLYDPAGCSLCAWYLRKSLGMGTPLPGLPTEVPSGLPSGQPGGSTTG